MCCRGGFEFYLERLWMAGIYTVMEWTTLLPADGLMLRRPLFVFCSISCSSTARQFFYVEFAVLIAGGTWLDFRCHDIEVGYLDRCLGRPCCCPFNLHLLLSDFRGPLDALLITDVAALITIRIADRNGGRLDEVAGRDLGLYSSQLPGLLLAI
ncbi:hypothetical protein ACLOJK_014821 [Asimina triloba]